MKPQHVRIVTNVYVQCIHSSQWIPEAKPQDTAWQKQPPWVSVALSYVEVINVPVWHMIPGGFEDPGGFTSP